MMSSGEKEVAYKMMSRQEDKQTTIKGLISLWLYVESVKLIPDPRSSYLYISILRVIIL